MVKEAEASVTVAVVAREAGVSVSTAARVLRGSSYPVKPAVAERVRAAAAHLGYVPNLLARNLRSGNGGALGLIVGDMSDAYFGKIASIIAAEAYERSFLAVVANMMRDPILEISQCRKLWEHRIGALILAGGGFDQMTHASELRSLLKKLQQSGVIVVSLSERNLDIPCFATDSRAVGELLASEALRLGHSRIGVVAGPAGSHVTQGRLSGIQGILGEAGLEAVVVHTLYSQHEAHTAAEKLFQIDPKVTMVLTTSDTLGVSLIDWLKSQGRSVPDEVSVLAVGNTNYCDISAPRMSSVDVNLEACCREAMRYISERWAGQSPEESPPFPAAIVNRESTGPLSGASAPPRRSSSRRKTLAS